MALALGYQACLKVTTRLNVEQHALLRWLVQVPLLLTLQLEQESVDIVVMRRKALLNFALAGVRRDVGIDASIVLKQLIAEAEQLRQTS